MSKSVLNAFGKLLDPFVRVKTSFWFVLSCVVVSVVWSYISIRIDLSSVDRLLGVAAFGMTVPLLMYLISKVREGIEKRGQSRKSDIGPNFVMAAKRHYGFATKFSWIALDGIASVLSHRVVHSPISTLLNFVVSLIMKQRRTARGLSPVEVDWKTLGDRYGGDRYGGRYFRGEGGLSFAESVQIIQIANLAAARQVEQTESLRERRHLQIEYRALLKAEGRESASYFGYEDFLDILPTLSRFKPMESADDSIEWYEGALSGFRSLTHDLNVSSVWCHFYLHEEAHSELKHDILQTLKFAVEQGADVHFTVGSKNSEKTYQNIMKQFAEFIRTPFPVELDKLKISIVETTAVVENVGGLVVVDGDTGMVYQRSWDDTSRMARLSKLPQSFRQKMFRALGITSPRE